MRLVRILFFLILSVFLLSSDTTCSCSIYGLGGFLCDPDEDCVYVYVINSSSRTVDVYFAWCCEEVSIPPGGSAGISVLLGHSVSANGQSHVFREPGEIWEIW
jgi:hypothetical protein